MKDFFSESIDSKKVDFYCYHEIDSTNRYCLNTVSEFNDYSVVIADKQTSGRGRFDRVWKSDTKGNVYASIVLKNIPQSEKNSNISTITQYASTIIRSVINEYSNGATIKWPNDILINSKKICGILSSVVFKNSFVDAVVIGFGINLINSEKDLKTIDKPATSLYIESGKVVKPITIIKEITEKFFSNLDRYFTYGFESIKDEYIDNLSTLNCDVTVSTPTGEVSGFADSISDSGELVMRDKENRKININTGDVVW